MTETTTQQDDTMAIDAWQEGWDAAQACADGNEDVKVSDDDLERYALHDGLDVAEFTAGWRAYVAR